MIKHHMLFMDLEQIEFVETNRDEIETNNRTCCHNLTESKCSCLSCLFLCGMGPILLFVAMNLFVVSYFMDTMGFLVCGIGVVLFVLVGGTSSPHSPPKAPYKNVTMVNGQRLLTLC